MADETSSNLWSGLPPWVKAAGQIGVPAALLIYLIVQIFGGSGGVAATTREIRDDQKVHLQSSDAHHREFHEAEQRREDEAAINRELLRAMCYNGATTAEERARCSPETKGK